MSDEIAKAIGHGLLDHGIVQRPEVKADALLGMVTQTPVTETVIVTRGTISRQGIALFVVCHTLVPLDATSALPRLFYGST